MSYSKLPIQERQGQASVERIKRLFRDINHLFHSTALYRIPSNLTKKFHVYCRKLSKHFPSVAISRQIYVNKKKVTYTPP